METLKGMVAVVTGASSGIGEATARKFASHGVNVVVVARRAERLEKLASESDLKSGSGQFLAFAGDITDRALPEAVVRRALDTWGRIDILVNNAGVMMLGSVVGAKVEDWDAMFEVNVMAALRMTHAVLPAMKARKSGQIINISSVSGRVVSARSAVYSATKFALNAFSEGLRQELAPDGVRVTVIEPGVVATELADHITDESVKDAVKKWAASMTPLAASDIADAVVFAASRPAHVNVNEILLRPQQQVA